ncbi:hypothetical protein [Exiguobacterium sp.]|uniref:hypothetical protein n=1 Tax=Exiguobacterium sp. TaxID=44751 RepID=UPI0028B1DC41|nr:hypothetical protein [Exiguobacterium sp.]
MQALCDSLRELRQQEDIDPSIQTSLFILDFLSVQRREWSECKVDEAVNRIGSRYC